MQVPQQRHFAALRVIWHLPRGSEPFLYVPVEMTSDYARERPEYKGPLTSLLAHILRPCRHCQHFGYGSERLEAYSRLKQSRNAHPESSEHASNASSNASASSPSRRS